MELPTTQRQAEPRPPRRIDPQRALDAWVDSLTPAEGAALRNRRRRFDPTYRKRLGITVDRRRA